MLIFASWVNCRQNHPSAPFLAALEASPLPGTDEYARAVFPFDRVHLQPTRSQGIVLLDIVLRLASGKTLTIEHPAKAHVFSVLEKQLSAQLSRPSDPDWASILELARRNADWKHPRWPWPE